MATLEALDRDALVRVLTEPRNALVKQYQKLMEYERIQLHVRARRAHRPSPTPPWRAGSARAGLRMILEELMLDLMYTLPGQKNGGEHLITRRTCWHWNSRPSSTSASVQPRDGFDTGQVSRSAFRPGTGPFFDLAAVHLRPRRPFACPDARLALRYP